MHAFRFVRITAGSALLSIAAAASALDRSPESSWRFLLSDRDRGGVLYRASAGELRDRRLPLSFVDGAAYWGEHVCQSSAAICGVTDRYDAAAFTLRPDKSGAGDLQTERVNIHNGSNIYDAASWQIALMLGAVRNGFPVATGEDIYALVGNQNRLLKNGYSGDATDAAPNQNRATTRGDLFRYNGRVISEPRNAWVFRTLPRAWLAPDPLIGSRYAGWIAAENLPAANSLYQRGKVSWTDWKPIAGENAWAFLLGPLQAAHIQYRLRDKKAFVPFRDVAVQNALDVLPAFAAMQAPIGAVYYAPAGTLANQGDDPVNRYDVAVENNLSLYAGLKILRATLQAELRSEAGLTAAERATIDAALRAIDTMIDGGNQENYRTQGLLAFFKNFAWRDGEFVQGGFADDPAAASAWLPHTGPKAVDVNTWGIAALGTGQIDEWFGFGAAFDNWQRLKQWGGYGVKKQLWGVGFSDRDGNGIDADGNYRQGVLSAEWTAGAITALRDMSRHYENIPAHSAHYATAKQYVQTLRGDEQSMLRGLNNLRIDRYSAAAFPGAPQHFDEFFAEKNGAYLYASRRYLIPFGWYANPLPSTCATAWAVMVDNHYNPFAPGGGQ